MRYGRSIDCCPHCGAPTLNVDKSGPATAHVGDVVSYTVVLTLGPDYSPVTITSVSDSLVGPLARADAVKTGGNSDYVLESGETWTWAVTLRFWLLILTL